MHLLLLRVIENLLRSVWDVLLTHWTDNLLLSVVLLLPLERLIVSANVQVLRQLIASVVLWVVYSSTMLVRRLVELLLVIWPSISSAILLSIVSIATVGIVLALWLLFVAS